MRPLMVLMVFVALPPPLGVAEGGGSCLVLTGWGM
jgi:hypothetical protein